jgi:hypothetical protein
MLKLVSTQIPIRPKAWPAIVVVIAGMVVPAAAPAQNHQSPDARAGVVMQDYRSPDAHKIVVDPASGFAHDVRSPDARTIVVDPASGFAHDVRSPDARVSGRYVTRAPQHHTTGSSSFEWGYLAAGIVLSLLIVAGIVLTTRRRRQDVVVGS